MENQKLPNSTASLVLGILSVVTCCCYGIIGLPLGIIALVLGNKAMKLYYQQPENYTGEGNAKAGKILGIIGIILNLVYLGYVVWLLSSIGWDAMQNPEQLQEKMQEMFQ